MSLRKIKDKYQMSFEPLTTPMWLAQFADKLDLKKSGASVTYHDSCHISRKIGQPEPARKLLSSMADITEMPRSGARDTWCCGYWGLRGNEGNDEQLQKLQQERFDEAHATSADTMVVECVTCLEAFGHSSADHKGVAVRDIVDLVHSQVIKS